MVDSDLEGSVSAFEGIVVSTNVLLSREECEHTLILVIIVGESSG